MVVKLPVIKKTLLVNLATNLSTVKNTTTPAFVPLLGHFDGTR